MSEERSAVLLLLLLLLEQLPAGHQTRPVLATEILRVLELLPPVPLKCFPEVPLLHQLVEEEQLTIPPMLTRPGRLPLAWLPR